MIYQNISIIVLSVFVNPIQLGFIMEQVEFIEDLIPYIVQLVRHFFL